MKEVTLTEIKRALDLYRREMKMIEDERSLLNKREKLAFERFLHRSEKTKEQESEVETRNTEN